MMILEQLEDYGEVSEEIRNKVVQERNIDVLKKWNKFAVKAETVEEFALQAGF